MTANDVISKRLRSIRANNNITQAKIAKRLNMAQTAVSRWERQFGTMNAERKEHKKMNNMIATLEIVRFVAAIALCTALFALAVYGLYRNIKETAETAIREEMEQAIKEASKPVVKVEIQTKGKW